LIVETTIALVIIFSVLVVFHELGHFIVAKRFGIRVDEFALGFGPKLVKLFKHHGTDYTVRALPLGGFVKLAGMDPAEEEIPDGFQAQAAWKRALVVAAGPVASFVLAILVFVFMGIYWGFPDSSLPQNRIGLVSPQTEAARIGLRAGDRVLSINGRPVTTGEQMTGLIHNNPGKRMVIELKRNGRKLTVVGRPRWNVQFAGAQWSFMRSGLGEIGGVERGSSAAKAGVKPGDRVMLFNSKVISDGADLVKAIESNGEGIANITLKRGKSTIDVRIKPELQSVEFLGTRWLFPGGYAAVSNTGVRDVAMGLPAIRLGDELVSVNGKRIKTGESLVAVLQKSTGPVVVRIRRDDTTKTLRLPSGSYSSISRKSYYVAKGLLGFVPEPSLVKTGFLESAGRGLSGTFELAGRFLGSIFSKQVVKEVGGPIMIANVTATSVALGPYWVMWALGSLSMSLALINLVPIPVVDGGHLAILAVEAIRRKRLTSEQMQVATLVGLAIIVVVAVVVMSSDIFKITHGLVPQ
jgi:regulator of sigma E protease